PGRAGRDSVEPVAQEFRLGDGRGLAHEDEEGRLECVFRVLGVAEDAPAQGQDHRTVPPHQGLKRVLVPVGQESLQQLVIRSGGEVRIGDQAVNEFDDGMYLSVWHGTDSPMKLSPLRYCEKLPCASRFFAQLYEKG